MSLTIELPQNLTIHYIEEHFNKINEELIDSDNNVIFDAKEVETIDTSGLQTLLVITQAIINNGKSISWENTPEILSTSAQKIGIDQALQLQ